MTMKKETSLSVKHISKKFRLYESNKDRIIEFFHPRNKRYHKEFWALKDINFDVTKGQTVGILGRNGSGKSTLLQIIAAVMHATSGTVKTNGRVAALLQLGAGFNPLFTGRQNAILTGVIQGIPEKEMLKKIPEIETFAEIGEYFDQPVAMYSSGMFVRLAFAASTSIDPTIILVDEALSVGDAKFQHKCFNRFRDFVEEGKTIIVVSHDVESLLKFCTQGLVLNSGNLVYQGDISSAISTYQDYLYGGMRDSIDQSRITPFANGPPEKSNTDNAETRIRNSVYSGNRDKDDFKDMCIEHPTYNPGETRFGDSRACIIDYSIIANGETNPAEISYGQEFDISMKVYFSEPLTQIHFGFAIVTKDGIYVHGTNTQLQHLVPIEVEGGEIVFITFSANALFVGGDYFLNLGVIHLTDSDQEVLEIRRSIAHLRFSDTDWCRGFVAIPPKVSILRKYQDAETNVQ